MRHFQIFDDFSETIRNFQAKFFAIVQKIFSHFFTIKLLPVIPLNNEPIKKGSAARLVSFNSTKKREGVAEI